MTQQTFLFLVFFFPPLGSKCCFVHLTVYFPLKKKKPLKINQQLTGRAIEVPLLLSWWRHRPLAAGNHTAEQVASTTPVPREHSIRDEHLRTEERSATCNFPSVPSTTTAASDATARRSAQRRRWSKWIRTGPWKRFPACTVVCCGVEATSSVPMACFGAIHHED